jgi:hypothetical protein
MLTHRTLRLRYNPLQTILECATENRACDHIDEQLTTRDRIASVSLRRAVSAADAMRLYDAPVPLADFLPSDA